ncbi:MAG: acyl-CoA desaturase [Bacteroidetes bacterium]|nr:acyl-CoA desaturase [Bacteroidota bacterium]HET6243356.1 acyl-CoA desaturase [Bacteroidia bacterium]
MPVPLKFKPSGNDFAKVLRKRVQDYFKEKNISVFSNSAMVFKTIFLLSLWIGSYCALIFGNIPLAFVYFVWIVLGISIALVSINIGHDAIHGAYTSKKWLTNLLKHTYNLNGASAYMWKSMHNVAHHTYTNVYGYDEDISPISIIRISPDEKLKPIHKYQHLYAFFFYGLATISWVFIKDYVKFFKNQAGNFNNSIHPKKEYFFLFFYKFLNYTIFLVLPLLVMDISWMHILGGYLLMHFVSGFYLAIVFMLAHGIEEVHFPRPEPTGILENDWAIHQLYTTANFSTGNSLAGFLTGGLNQQIEHHLFPYICSIHYRALAKIVQDTAAEYDLPYYDKPTFFSALSSHYLFLKRIGKEKDYRPSNFISQPNSHKPLVVSL